VFDSLHAFDSLPSHLGYMLAEIPQWFRKSDIRREAFKELFNVMNPLEDRAGTPLPFMKMSTTRWLVRGKLITNILLNWNELKAYFACVEVSGGAAARYKARMLSSMLNDEVNYLYFTFLSPVVAEFERVNAIFQASSADPDFLVKELTAHYRALKCRVQDNQGNPKSVSQVDFGGKFLCEVQRLTSQVKCRDFEQKISELKDRCVKFLHELVAQVE
jgi:hypothetical protein